jgi:hypothetical protein
MCISIAQNQTAYGLEEVGQVRDPVHCGSCPPGVAWSTVNASEALPGVVTWSLR